MHDDAPQHCDVEVQPCHLGTQVLLVAGSMNSAFVVPLQSSSHFDLLKLQYSVASFEPQVAKSQEQQEDETTSTSRRL